MWKPIPMRTNTNERCGLAYTQSRFGVGFANSISHIKKALEHPRADAEKRRAFQKKIEEHKKDGKPIVYIDESGFVHDMPPISEPLIWDFSNKVSGAGGRIPSV